MVAPPVRTLVISDLHLGSRLERDVLRHPQPLAALLRALDDVDRLVLLGDAVELMEGRATQAMAIAEPVLHAIGERMGPDREVILVPGNHDAPLIRRWLRATGGPDGLDAPVPPSATPMLARVVTALGPGRVRVHYPGVWLTERIYATHGHYLDRHLLPESGYGVARGLLGRVPRDGATAAEYERSRSPSLARMETLVARTPRPLAAIWDDLAEIMRASTMPGIHRRVLRRRLAPLTAFVLGLQMRRASLPALGRVVHRLGVDAEHVVFGHVHRSGPLAGDDPRRWRGPGGTPHLANTGSWVYEALLVHRARPPHPYWPGGAILIEDGGPPRAIGLLDHLGPRALHPPQTRAGSLGGRDVIA
jgi:UDP-2,3-diacylglucosamine pyrophosphatase LpxH